MQRLNYWVAVFILMMSAVAVMAVQPVHAKLKTQKIQIPGQMPVGHPISQAVDLFCNEVNEKSNGRLVLVHFPSGQLLTDKEIPKALSRGTVKMAQTFLPWWSGIIPDIYPYGGKQVLDYAHFQRFSGGSFGKYWKERLEKKGRTKSIAPLLYTTLGGYITTVPVKRFGDMKGLKIRVPSRQFAAEVQALGGTPTVLSSADVYMALQRGTIQGAMSGLGSFYTRKWYEVAKHVFLLRSMPSEFHIAANLKWFNSLPPDLRTVVTEAGHKAATACRKMVLELEDDVRIELEKRGVSITEVSENDYQTHFAPTLEPALKASAVKEFGQQLADQVDQWIEETR